MPDRMGHRYLFKKAQVVDGLNNKPFIADVAVESGCIIAIGDFTANDDAVEIDAEDLILCPGFIDIHSHIDSTLRLNNKCLNLVAQGITTAVGGNCGNSVAPNYGESVERRRQRRQSDENPLSRQYDVWEGSLREWMNEVRQVGTGVNVMMLAGQGSVRGSVVGIEAERPASEDEILQMQQLVRASLEAGAVGISTGRDYVPGCYATADEVTSVCEPLREYDGAFYACHLKDEASGLLDAIREALQIGRNLAVPVQISHHKVMIPENWGKIDESLSLVDSESSSGRQVRLDVYPYAFSATIPLMDLLPPWFVSGGREKSLHRLQNKTEFPRLRQDMESGYPGWKSSLGDFDWGYTILLSPHTEQYEGRTIKEIALSENSEPIEVLRQLLLKNSGEVLCAFAMDEEDVKKVIQHQDSAICTDTFALDIRQSGFSGVHPRTYGTYPRLFSHYVFKQQTLTLPEAVYKCSGLPAQWLGLSDRGVIREGAAADLVVFNPADLKDRATLHQPCQYPDGIEWVLVGGQAVVAEGELVGETPGQVLDAR